MTTSRQPAGNQQATSRQPAGNQREGEYKGGEVEKERKREVENSNTSFARNDEASAPSRRKAADCAIRFDDEKQEIVGVTEADLAKWSAAYPALNLNSEIVRATMWLVANPTKRKKDVRRFLVNWLARSQERGGDRGGVSVSVVGQTGYKISEKAAAMLREQGRRLLNG